MSLARAPSPLAWAVLAMEASVAFPLVTALVGGPERGAPLAPFAAVGMLPLGYVAGVASAARGLEGWRWGAGLAASLAARLLAGPPPEEATPLGLLGWLASALLPASVGLALWWRGLSAAEAQLGADEVRAEFTTFAAGLLALFGLYGHLVVVDPAARLAVVLAFLSSGLLAVVLSRQAAAGAPASPGSTAQAIAWTLLCLALAAALVGALSPGLLETLAALAREVVLAVLRLLLLPLALLFSLLRLELPPADGREGQSGIRQMPLPERQALPEWLNLLLGALTLGALALLAIVAAVALLVVARELWRLVWPRLGRDGRAPLAAERESSPADDLRALLHALRAWLARLAGAGLALAGDGSRPIQDARAAYRALLRWAQRNGLERAPAETPRELQRRLEAHLPWATPHFALLTDAYELARYADLPPSAHDLLLLRESLEALERFQSPARSRQ